MTNCQTCKDKIDSILSDLPSSWRAQISESICQVFTSLDEQNCELVNKCQTLTELSEFTRDGSKVCITYKDEDEISYERCFDFVNIINSLLDEVNPKCIVSASVWATLTFDQRIQAIIDRACHVATNTLFTTTSTTSTSSTSTSSTSTTSSSTTTSTTEVPVCGCFSIQNFTPSVYPIVYDNCGTTSISLILDPGQKKYVCSTFAGITNSINNVVETIFLGDCSVCQQLNATTTTTSTSTSTTTTTSSTTTTTTVCPTNNVCINIFECATGAPACDSPSYILIPDFNLGLAPIYLTPIVCGAWTLYLVKDLTNDTWYLSEDINDPSGTAVAESSTLYGIWTNLSLGQPTDICITVNEVDQNLRCIPLPPPTTTTTSSTTSSTTTTSSSTTTTTTDPCLFNGGSAIITPTTTTTSSTTTTTTNNITTTTSSTTTSSTTTSSTTTTSSSTTTTTTVALFTVTNNGSNAAIITDISNTAAWYLLDVGALPLSSGNTVYGAHGGYVGNIDVTIDSGPSPFLNCLKLYINGILIQSVSVNLSGVNTYSFTGITIGAGQTVLIYLDPSAC